MQVHSCKWSLSFFFSCVHAGKSYVSLYINQGHVVLYSLKKKITVARNSLDFSLQLYISVAPLKILWCVWSDCSSVWTMGTTASAGSQPAAGTPTHHTDHQTGDIAEDKRSMSSSSSSQVLNIPNSKAKSIITNKVAPVVIT